MACAQDAALLDAGALAGRAQPGALYADDSPAGRGGWLGLFAVTFNASLGQNASDRAAYDAGANLRLVTTSPEARGLDKRIGDRLRAQPGVQVVSPAYRGRASTTSDFGNLERPGAGNLARHLPSDGGRLSWRYDYAGKPLNTLMSDLASAAWTVGWRGFGAHLCAGERDDC